MANLEELLEAHKKRFGIEKVFLESLDLDALRWVYYGMHNCDAPGYVIDALSATERVQFYAGIWRYKKSEAGKEQICKFIADNDLISAVSYLIGIGEKNLLGHYNEERFGKEKYKKNTPLRERLAVKLSESSFFKTQNSAFIASLGTKIIESWHKNQAHVLYEGHVGMTAPISQKEGVVFIWNYLEVLSSKYIAQVNIASESETPEQLKLF
ncbi:MAG: hypothetical protein V1859_10010 [archaeon]